MRHQRDEDLRDDDMITDSRISDSKLPGYDKGKKHNEYTDLADTEEANFDVHHVKRIIWQALGRSIKKNEAGPTRTKYPKSRSRYKELDYPDDDRMEQGKDDEVNYKEPKEITPPSPKASLIRRMQP